MQFGVNTFLFTSRFTCRDTEKFPGIKKIGFDTVEITLQEPEDWNSSAVKAAMDQSGLTCCCLCGIFGPGRDLRGTEYEQQTSADFIRLCIDRAADMKCNLVSGPLYSRVGRAGYEEPDQRKRQFDTVAGHLKRLCGYAADKGIRLGLEPLIRFETDFANTCRDLLPLLDAVGAPNLGIHLDTFHMNTEEADPILAVSDAGKKLFHLHLADNTRGAPGSGTFNWQGFRSALKRIGYDSALVLECFHPDVPDISYAASVRRKLSASNYKMAEEGLRFLHGLFGI